jgi:hypothetical protein
VVVRFAVVRFAVVRFVVPDEEPFESWSTFFSSTATRC